MYVCVFIYVFVCACLYVCVHVEIYVTICFNRSLIVPNVSITW